MNIYKLTDFGDQSLIIGSRADYRKKNNLRLVKKDWLNNVNGNISNADEFYKPYGFDENAFLKKYQLKAVQFGNWMKYSDRADHFLALVQSLGHLSKIIGTDNLGWMSNLSIAIGARGKSGALAHFEPGMSAINLTKEKGGHSFAHEYGHAIDFIGGKYFSKNPKIFSISDAYATETNPENCATDEVRNLVGIIIDGVRSGERYHTLEVYSKHTGRYRYWCNNTEIFARTFAQWVALQCKEKKFNDILLAKTVDSGNISEIPLKELKVLNPYFKKLVKLCSEFLKTGKKAPKATTKNPFIKNKTQITTTRKKKKVAAVKNSTNSKTAAKKAGSVYRSKYGSTPSARWKNAIKQAKKI